MAVVRGSEAPPGNCNRWIDGTVVAMRLLISPWCCRLTRLDWHFSRANCRQGARENLAVASPSMLEGALGMEATMWREEVACSGGVVLCAAILSRTWR